MSQEAKKELLGSGFELVYQSDSVLEFQKDGAGIELSAERVVAHPASRLTVKEKRWTTAIVSNVLPEGPITDLKLFLFPPP